MPLLSHMNPIYRILAASFFWGMGGSLNWLFLNFHLEALGFSKTLVGYANATPALAAVLFSLPLALLIPRLGYTRSIRVGGVLAAGPRG
ncbi:MAG: MFS transporter, partial [Meiothermus silvanus]|nr:MFS transporter [Allomeiothermus silvanus]